MQMYRYRVKLDKCARCGNNDNFSLHVHHIDHNHYNDEKNNLIVLCQSCHKQLHHNKWDIKELGYEVTEYCTETIINSKVQRMTLERIKLLNEWDFKRKFTAFELKPVAGFTGNTLRALIRKGVVSIVGDAPVEGPEYYQWTGKELE